MRPLVQQISLLRAGEQSVTELWSASLCTFHPLFSGETTEAHNVVLKGCWSPVLCVLGGPQVNEFSFVLPLSWILVPAWRPLFTPACQAAGSSSMGPSPEPVSILACGGCWNGCWINEGNLYAKFVMFVSWNCCSFYITTWQIEKIKHQFHM